MAQHVFPGREEANGQRPSLRLFAFVAMVLLYACETDTKGGIGPRMLPLDNFEVMAGEKVTVLVEAVAGDESDLTFYVKGRPRSAQFVALDNGVSALFSWIPEVTDSDPGGQSHTVEFQVTDAGGRMDSQEIQIVVFPPGGPEFLNPPGFVLDLSRSEYFETTLSVKDDSASRVDFQLLGAPDGAYLEQSGKKQAYVFWRPGQDQVAQRSFWYLRVEAKGYGLSDGPQDGDVLMYTITRDFPLILINQEEGGCPGTPPILVHVMPFDQHSSSWGEPDNFTIPFETADAESGVSSAVVMWSTNPNSGFKATPASRLSGSSYEALIPWFDAEDGQLIYYSIEVSDDDDYQGTACDHVARYPKQGLAAFGVYGPDQDTACVDDALETHQEGDASIELEFGTHSALRLCPGDSDLFRFPEAEYAFGLALTGSEAEENLVMTAIDENSLPAGDPVTGSGVMMLQPGQGLLVESTGNEPVTYTLTVHSPQGTCVPDSLEPNNSIPPSRVLPSESTTLTLCPGDADLFEANLPAGGTLVARIDFVPTAGDLDLYMLTSDGQGIIRASESTFGMEQVAFTTPESISLVIAVVGYEGAYNSYVLSSEFLEPGSVCLEDGFAPNNTANEAVPIVPYVYDGLLACPKTSDWFLVGLNGGETIDVSAIGEVDGLKLTLVGPDGLVLCTASDGQGKTTARCLTSEAGNYLVEVANSGDSVVAYSLDLTIEPPAGGCEPDRMEPNDTLAEASEVNGSILSALSLCAGDEDYFSFRIYNLQYFTLMLLPSDFGTQVLLELYDTDNGQLVAVGQELDSSVVLEFAAEATGDYVARVAGLHTSLSLYSLLAWME